MSSKARDGQASLRTIKVFAFLEIELTGASSRLIKLIRLTSCGLVWVALNSVDSKLDSRFWNLNKD